mgnify:CR=1 FL=1
MNVPGRKTKILFDENALRNRIKTLGKQITADHVGHELVVVGVLKGAVVFLTDLIRAIDLPLEVDFIGVQSYEGTESTGQVRLVHDLTCEIKGKHVLIVEDIIDSGRTIDYLLSTLEVRQPASIKVCALLSKPESHSMHHKIDYCGFEITKEFVVGYGLDLDGKFRNYPYIIQIVD